MTRLTDIERGYEAKYSNDLEADFKAVMRRNKLLGLWVAEQMGITGSDADAYAREVIESDFIEPGHDDVVRKILADLKSKDVDISEHIIGRKMEEFLIKAKEEMQAE